MNFVLPFALTGIMKLIAFAFSCFIHEPAVDTDKFSFVNFISQTKKGFIHLFRPELIRSTLLILLFGSFSLVAYEMLDDIAVVDWGFDGVQIGYIYAAATVLAMISSYLYEPISKKVRTGVLLAVGIGFLVLNYIFSPWISSTIWVGLFLTRCFYSSIRQGAISELLNRNTPSNIRATTISTYELIRKVPYVFLAGFIGVTMESIGVKWFSHYFVLALVVLLAVYILLHKVIFRNTAG